MSEEKRQARITNTKRDDALAGLYDCSECNTTFPQALDLPMPLDKAEMSLGELEGAASARLQCIGVPEDCGQQLWIDLRTRGAAAHECDGVVG